MPAWTGAAILGGSLIAANASGNAADSAAAAAQFDPMNINTGIGTVTAQDGTVTTQLSPELQALRDQLYGQAGQGLQAFQTFDPNQAAGLFTNQLAALAAPQEQQQRLSNENRLMQQGLLDSTLGINRTGNLLQQQNLAGQSRALQGQQFGQQQQRGIFDQAMGFLNAGTNLDTLAANQLSPFASIGGAQTAGNIAGANFQFQAGMNEADMISGFFNNLGTSLYQNNQPTQNYNYDFGAQGIPTDQYLVGGF